MNIRKSVRNLSLSPQELANLRSAYGRMMNIRDDRGYRYWAGVHGIPDGKCKHGEAGTILDPNFRLFLPWHRAYLYWFEKFLQDAQRDPTIAVPWWDWTSNESRRQGIPKAFSDETVDGNPNPLYKFRVEVPADIDLEPFAQIGCPRARTFDTHREPGLPSRLPKPEDINKILEENRDYGDFSDALEDIHDGIHGWVGGRCGDMGFIEFAAYDPIFWSHHCMIDRIFWLWQMKPGNSLPLYLYDEVLDPFRLTVRQVLNIYQLGYDYASQQQLVEM